MSHTVLRGLWCGTIQNVLGPTQDEMITPRAYCIRIQSRYLIISLRTKWRFCYFNAKLGRDDTLNPVIETETLLDSSNDNGVKVVNFDASKNVNVKSTKFMHQNFHKYNLTSHDGKTHRFITSQKAGNVI
jgi:hypothetical protein